MYIESEKKFICLLILIHAQCFKVEKHQGEAKFHPFLYVIVGEWGIAALMNCGSLGVI